MKKRWLIVLAMGAGMAAGGGAWGAEFRPPATPLVTVDPYFSIWSFSDKLYESWPVHWTGKTQPLCGLIRVDGKPYRFMGKEERCAEVAEQKALAVDATQTHYTFQAGAVELKVTFVTPMLPARFNWMTCPVTFLSFEARSSDNQAHEVRLYVDAGAEIAVNEPTQEVVWERVKAAPGEMRWLKVGTKEQAILAKDGDDLRIDWGYLYLGVPAGAAYQAAVAGASEARGTFLKTGKLPGQDDARMPRAANDAAPVLACTAGLTAGPGAAAEATVVLAYDDLYSIEYMQQKLRPWWFAAYGSFEKMAEEVVGSLAAIRAECEQLDREVREDARRAGGEKYAQIAALAYRQTLASGKVVAAPDGKEPWFFTKECFSNGCTGTVDVAYPGSPYFALFSPALLYGMMAPVFDYAESGKWPHPFAPHDVGRYPRANGQVYGRMQLEKQMPVEECGNMILMTAALVRASGSAEYAKRHWKVLTQWAEYLAEKGLDPENQLCTDDFTGHLAHNANLSLKAINALGAYAQLCGELGEAGAAEKYQALAKEMAGKWAQMAGDGDHYRLTFDKAGTWSMKYNLVWDRVLGLGLFDPQIASKEAAYYLKRQNKYGLPLDNRADFTKSDWLVWSACLAEAPQDFQKLVEPLYAFLNESPSRAPFSDWYWTSTAEVRGFRARTVVGGVFLRFLYDRGLWQKWAGRGGKPGSGAAPAGPAAR